MVNVNKNLKSIGKKIFIDYYYDFKDNQINKNILAKKLLDENPKASTIDGQLIRISYAREIFSHDAQKEALEIIMMSNRLEATTICKAKRIYAEEFGKESVKKSL